MDFGYKAGLVEIVVVFGFLVSMAFRESPFPPVDRSSRYEYCVQDDGVYLLVVRHDEYIFITQSGIWHSATPELVKRNNGHNVALDLLSKTRKMISAFDKLSAYGTTKIRLGRSESAP